MENVVIGKYCIVRGDRSGVFAGTVTAQNGREVVFENVRRLWRWYGATDCFQLSKEGVRDVKDNNRITVEVSQMAILDAIEIIPCTPEAEKSIREMGEWKF